MSLTAGFGRAELTPPLGVELAGYGYYLERRATCVRDPLFARALALQDGGERALIVSCDLLGLSEDIVREVKHAANALGFADEKIILVSIHTHTGPCVAYHLGCGEVNPAYAGTAAGRIIQAIQAAVSDMRPVRALKTGVSLLPEGFAYNRAIADAPVDFFVRGAQIERVGAPDIALVSFACHGVSLGNVSCVSADYSGEVHRLLQARGMESIYVNGLCGDIDPVAPKDKAEREQKMLLFAKAIEKAYFEHLAPAPLSLRAGRIPFSLRVNALTPDEIKKTADDAVARYGGDETLPISRVARRWEEIVLSRGTPPDHEDVWIPYARLGDLLIAAFPFEGYTLTGSLVREILQSSRVITLGCAERLRGYLPTREDIARMSYAAVDSAFLYQRMPPVPGEAERLGETIGHALRNEGMV